jgi:hypothetical protein
MSRYYGANARKRRAVMLTEQTKSALERFESETGEKVADNVPDPEDEAVVSLFLIMAPEGGRDDLPH